MTHSVRVIGTYQDMANVEEEKKQLRVRKLLARNEWSELVRRQVFVKGPSHKRWREKVKKYSFASLVMKSENWRLKFSFKKLFLAKKLYCIELKRP